MSDTPRTDNDNRTYPSPEHAQRIVFEGCECVVMAPEEYQELFDHARKLELELNKSNNCPECRSPPTTEGWACGSYMALMRSERCATRKLEQQHAAFKAAETALIKTSKQLAIKLGYKELEDGTWKDPKYKVNHRACDLPETIINHIQRLENS